MNLSFHWLIKKRTRLMVLLYFIFSLSSNFCYSQCNYKIPENIQSGSVNLGGSGSNVRLVKSGETLYSNGGGSQKIYIESNGYANIQNTGSSVIYVRKNGTLVIGGGGGSNTIIYDSLAIVKDSLSGGGGNVFTKCRSLLFQYYDDWKPEYALELDGKDDKISVSNPLTKHDTLTITAWAKLKTNNSQKVLLSDWSTSGSSFNINQYYLNGKDLFRFQFRSLPNNSLDIAIPIPADLYNAWGLYSLTLNPDSIRIYINGIKIGATKNTIGSLTKYSNLLTIGNEENSSAPFEGQISEIAIFNRELSAKELLNIVENRVDKTSKSLISLFRFTDGQGTTSTDSIRNLQISLINNPKWVYDSPYKLNTAIVKQDLVISQSAIFDSISITNGSKLTLGGDLTVTDLYVKNGTIDLNGKRLTVTGKIIQSTDSNNYYVQAGTSATPKSRSELVIKPSSAANSTIYFNPNANRLNRLEIGNGSAATQITLGNSLKIKGGEDGGSGPGLLTVNKNSKIVIPSGSILTLESDTFNAGLSLIQPAQRSIVCTGTGKFSIERDHYGVRGWRLYSHPFKTDIDLQEVANDIELIGAGGTAEGFYSDNYKNGAAYWYDYSKADSSAATDPAWRAFTSAKGTTINGNANKWEKNSTMLLFNPGNSRGTGAFSNPSGATYEQGKISLKYTLDSNSVHLNDGTTQTINATTVPSYVPTSGLVGYWPFNGDANDESGNGNNGTVYGAKLDIDRFGNIKNAYKFNVNNWTWGSGGDMIYIPYNSEFNSETLSVSAWFKRTSGGLSWNAQDLSIIKRFQYGYNSPNGATFQVGIDNRNGANPNKLYVNLIEQGPSASKTVISILSKDSVSLNKWNNVTYTLSANIFCVYLNGKLLDSTSLPTGFKINTQGNSGLSIGMSDQANGHWGPYDGLIDDIGIWNRALSATEISALFNSANNTSLSSTSKYFFITNPYTAPVKLCRIHGLNLTNVDPYFYYWKQRRNTVTNNFSPAEWQAEKIFNGTALRDSNISIPAFGTILVRLKNSGSTTFTIHEGSKQLSNYNYIIGGAKGVSKTGLMFFDATGSDIGSNGVEIKLLVNDSQEADRVLIYNEVNQSAAYTTYDAAKYTNTDFPNIYTMSADAKPLAIDMQDIKSQLDAGKTEVVIPITIKREANKRYASLKMELSANTTGMEMSLKDNKSNSVDPWFTGNLKSVQFAATDAEINRYSLVFKQNTTSVKDLLKDITNNKNNASKSELTVYPNPTDGKLTLKLSNGDNYQGNYQIFDMTGRLLMEGKSQKTQIDASKLSSGQYIIKTKSQVSIFNKN